MSHWPNLSCLLLLKLVTNPENRFTTNKLEFSDSQPWLHSLLFPSSFPRDSEGQLGVRLITFTPNLSHLGKGVDPWTKFGLSEKKNVGWTNNRTHTTTLHLCFPNTFTPFCSLLKASYSSPILQIRKVRLVFPKWNYFKSCKSPYVSVQ